MSVPPPPVHAPGRIYSLARPGWLDLHDEEVLDPARQIIDPHLHLWDKPGERFLLNEVLADIGSGHNVVASVYVECHAMYRATGPQSHKPIGEVEFANGIAAQSASGRYGAARINAAIVGHADLMLGDAVRAVLEEEIAAGGGRFRGIRHSTAYDADKDIAAIYPVKEQGLMEQARFREGFAHLAALGLTFDSWLLFPQIPELAQLAGEFPDTTIILNHCGGPIGIGRYRDSRAETFETWRANIQQLAKRENVCVKLGGLGLRLLGLEYELRAQPPSSEELAAAWRPYFETCIEAFGPSRCMFESDFPPDKGQASYRVLFNAFKRVASQFSDSEIDRLFSGSAGQVYRIAI